MTTRPNRVDRTVAMPLRNVRDGEILGQRRDGVAKPTATVGHSNR